MKLYVIRHGQTNCNKENKYNCRYDEDINETGIMQAKEASNNVKKLEIDLIICSPLKRAKQTMDLINVNNVPVTYDDRIIEREGGILTLTTVDSEFDENEYHNYYSKKTVEGLETLPNLLKRVFSFLDELKEKYQNKNILIVTHDSIGRAIQFYFEKLPADGKIFKISGQKNCEIRKYEL